MVVTVLFEIPLMYWAPQLLKRFETGTLIVVAELSYSIRTLVYTLVGTNTWLLLLVEPLHGVTYALLATSTTEHVASVVSPGTTFLFPLGIARSCFASHNRFRTTDKRSEPSGCNQWYSHYCIFTFHSHI